MDLIIIRHARPERIESAPATSEAPADPSLTEIGHKQAQAVADWLSSEPIDALYVSPMARARQTAAPVEKALDMSAIVEAGVQEYDASDSQYLPMEEVRADKAAWQAFVASHGTTDWSGFRRVVTESIESIIARHKGQTVAIVCHGGVVNAWGAEVLGLEETMFFAPEYTSISRFRAASSGERSVVSLNETGHLKADGLHLTY